MIWLMLALASLAIAYMLATFKKPRSRLETILQLIGHISEENVKQGEELNRLIMAKDEDLQKIEESKETNKGRIGQLHDRIKNSKKVQETLIIKTQSWKLDR